MQRTWKLPLAFFVLALIVRLLLLYGPYGNLRHGSAEAYGSAALGLYTGKGLTLNADEVLALQSTSSNLTGDYRTVTGDRPRVPFTEFLPGPALLTAGLWYLLPVYNFAPYLYVQILLESVLIGVFCAVFLPYHRVVVILTTAAMVLNVAVIRRTLMMGYDFWPQFTVLATVAGVVYILATDKPLRWYVLLGCVTAITLWFRDITTLLPVGISLVLFFVSKKRKVPTRRIIGRVAGYLAPFLVSVILLSVLRYETTGSFRPTRSTFWHTFMAGVGQFSNPYGIVHSDESVWEYATTLNPALAASTLPAMSQLPDSPYEMLLKEKAGEFVTQHPDLALRNMFFRVVIMIAPAFYEEGDFMPRSVARQIYPVGFVLLLLWILGMIHMRREYSLLFFVSLAVYITFMVSFSWFYVVGRTILPFIFLSVMIWLFGTVEAFVLIRKAARTVSARVSQRP